MGIYTEKVWIDTPKLNSVHLWRKEMGDLVFKTLLLASIALYYFCDKNCNGLNQENPFEPILLQCLFFHTEKEH